MGYVETKHKTLSERMKYELKLDAPVWESEEFKSFLTEKEKDLINNHINQIKKELINQN